MATPKTTGERVKEFRERAELSQVSLAAKLFVTSEHISMIEAGKRNPSHTLAIRMANFFRISLNELYGLKLPKGKR